jgi:hypothetical protein
MERLTIALRKREDVVALRWPERTKPVSVEALWVGRRGGKQAGGAF